LAVKLVYQGYLYDEIETILDVSRGSITGWKRAYEENGIEGLRLNYQGRKSSIDYLRYLLNESPDQQLLILWDGASYHRSKEIRGFLEEINQGLETEQWKIHCIRFAPNCPEQNPIEDIWLYRFLMKLQHILPPG
jgi:transposase